MERLHRDQSILMQNALRLREFGVRNGAEMKMKREWALGGCVAPWFSTQGVSASKEALREPEPGAVFAARNRFICHKIPNTDALARKSCRFGLSHMRLYLGKTDDSRMNGESENVTLNLRSRELGLRNCALLPDAPLIDDEQWSRLRARYFYLDPEEAIPRVVSESVGKGIELFEGHDTQYALQPPITSSVAIDDESNEILVEDSRVQQFSRLDSNAAMVGIYATGALFVYLENKAASREMLEATDRYAKKNKKRSKYDEK